MQIQHFLLLLLFHIESILQTKPEIAFIMKCLAAKLRETAVACKKKAFGSVFVVLDHICCDYDSQCHACQQIRNKLGIIAILTCETLR